MALAVFRVAMVLVCALKRSETDYAGPSAGQRVIYPADRSGGVHLRGVRMYAQRKHSVLGGGVRGRANERMHADARTPVRVGHGGRTRLGGI